MFGEAGLSVPAGAFGPAGASVPGLSFGAATAFVLAGVSIMVVSFSFRRADESCVW